MSRPKGDPEEIGIRANPALDLMERWTTACKMWNDCNDCPFGRPCENLGDFLIAYLSNPHLSVRIRVVCSSSIT